MNFSEALDLIKLGYKVKRQNWNAGGQFIFLIKSWYTGDNPTGNDGPFLAIKPVNDIVVPWLPSQTDILADDWTNYD